MRTRRVPLGWEVTSERPNEDRKPVTNLELLWRFGTRQLERSFGWAWPIILAVVLYFFLYGFSRLTPGGWLTALAQQLLLLLMVFAAALFWSVYAALWRGESPWMKRKQALLLAIAWSIGLWLLAVAFLAPLSAGLYDEGAFGKRLSGLSDAGRFQTQWEFARLYLWQGLDALPGLDAADTLSLHDPPVKRYDWRLGSALLLCKAAVLIPLVAALKGVWEAKRGGGAK